MEIAANPYPAAAAHDAVSRSPRQSAATLPPHGADRLTLRQACAEMESLFIAHLLKEMRASVSREGLIQGGMGEEIFTSLMDGELARTIAVERSLGLAALLEAQLARYVDDPSDQPPPAPGMQIRI